ncbi:hypothetical protein JAAARDRAFT_41093 [Jaapia argillacea MUCL 33604]|uniref:Uncharacterized protein n=1 Tax=Jaapia argillacea MUCL 33604 TaxID=933084 RepID=A0A067PCA1_9AGAM|nr:hypothetical protein JAAARDRAFT_41093 [Jaapia argillacea MUCL 33604]
MATIDSFSANNTTVKFTWPPSVTGVERIMLSAHGDLQRLLSAFFARPVTVNVVHSQTSPEPSPSSPLPSPSCPINQARQVHLMCASRIICVATSTVTVTSSTAAKLFLEDKYAIGQVFRALHKIPEFTLLGVGLSEDKNGGEKKLWRKYRLSTEGFACEIEEVFPDREMFVSGEEWLLQASGSTSSSQTGNATKPADTESGRSKGWWARQRIMDLCNIGNKGRSTSSPVHGFGKRE